MSFYQRNLFNDHWGEQAHVNPDNKLAISMTSYGLDLGQAKEVWQPFLDWISHSPNAYSIEGHLTIGSIPARHMWDWQWWKESWPQVGFPNPNGNPLIGLLDYGLTHLMQPIFVQDQRPGASPVNAWWKGDAGQVGWFIWGFQSLWFRPRCSRTTSSRVSPTRYMPALAIQESN